MVQSGCEGMILVGDSDADPTIGIASTMVQYGCRSRVTIGDDGREFTLCPFTTAEAGETPAPPRGARLTGFSSPCEPGAA